MPRMHRVLPAALALCLVAAWLLSCSKTTPTKPGIVQRVRQVFEELVDLRELGPHRRPHAAIGRRDAHDLQQLVGTPLG